MIELVRYHTLRPARNGGKTSSVRVALVKESRKWLYVLAIDAMPDSGLRIWKVDKAERKYMKPLMRKGKPYPIKRALPTFRRFGKTHGMTKAVKRFLKEASNEQKARQDSGGESPASSSGDNA